MNWALRRMGYISEGTCSHGFRCSASTILNEREYEPDVIEAALAHQHKHATRGTNNRARYWPDRVNLLQDWADFMPSLSFDHRFGD